MNRFQAMAKIVARLTANGRLKPGSRKYKIARKLVARTIDRLGPDAALVQVVDRQSHLLEKIEILAALEATGGLPAHLDF